MLTAMEPIHANLAVKAAKASATELGLRVEDADVLNDSNRLTVRLLPCDVLVRVAPLARQADAAFEVEVVRRLAQAECPVAGLDPRVEPRVYVRDGFAVTYWAYHETVAPDDTEPAEFAEALARLHGGMQAIDVAAAHFSERAESALRVVEDEQRSPELADEDRELLTRSLRNLSASASRRGAREQLLHGEPHPGNMLRTKNGLLFTDFETCRRGPVEFDIAWYMRVGPEAWRVNADSPDAVGRIYPGVDRELIRTCWMLMQAIVAAWRWSNDDEFPDRSERRQEWLRLLRNAVERYGLG